MDLLDSSDIFVFHQYDLLFCGFFNTMRSKVISLKIYSEAKASLYKHFIENVKQLGWS